jgi:hypothetical protein
MKATISEEPAVYTIDVDGRKLRGLRVAGDLGPVRMLKDDKGEQVFILRHEIFKKIYRYEKNKQI